MKRISIARRAQPGCGAMALIILAMAPIEPAFAQNIGDRTIYMSDALARALDNNPAVSASLAEVDALNADAAMAGRWDNPTLSAEVEDFGGDRNGWGDADTTVSVSQVVPLGGDRRWAYRTERAWADAAAVESAAIRAELLADTARAHIDAYAASETYAVRLELLETAQRTADAINARVDAGRASPIERRRAEVLIARASIALSEAERARIGAIQSLAAIWGGANLDGQLASPLEGLNLDAIASMSHDEVLSSNLQLAQLRAASTASGYQVRRERASAIPDVTIGAGARRFGGSDEVAYLATIELPIPVINQNRDGIRAALSRENGARFDEEATRRSLLREFAQAASRFAQSKVSVTQLEESVLPASRDAFSAAQEAYGEGAMDLLDLLDIQRTYFDVRIDLIAARAALARAAIDIDLLAGAPSLSVMASTTVEEG